jgi:pimeloyl-ACP methyl ester carboxylesterase
MSEPLRESFVDLGGRRTRLLSAGEGPRTLLLLHTGAPGRSPIAASADLFAGVVARLDLTGLRVLAPDLPGAGGTDLLDLADLTTPGVVAFAEQLLAAVAADGPVEELHVLAQGEASLPALALARDGAGGVPVASLFLVAPNAAAPIGDSIQNVSLLDPPQPRFTARSQRWALERLAYVPDRVGAEVLAKLVDNAQGAPHARAVQLLADPTSDAALLGAQIDAQDAFYAYCRDESYTLPITVVWGAADPTATVARGTVFASILAGGPAHLDFQLVNQCGHLAQYDRPEQLAAAVRSALTRAAAV